MKKILKRIVICSMFVLLFWSAFLISDRKNLSRGLIRFHVVAHSDNEEDQAMKMAVRDAVLQSIQLDLQCISDIQQAKEYLEENLPKIQQLADQTLEKLGFAGTSTVSLCKEKFNIRHYDTFSLPAGVYDSLRIVIGDGLGRNWWCVSFPTLCVPATTTGFADAAIEAGFSRTLVQTLSGSDRYHVRFFLLDQLGKLENIFFQE